MDPSSGSSETSRLRASDEVELVVEHHRLADPRARILIVHGFGEHRRRYHALIAELAANGYECHSFDLRGHGDSEGKVGHVERFERYRRDLALVAAEVAPPAGPARPLVLLGHSLGGLVVLSSVVHRTLECDGVVLSSPFLRSARKAPPGAETLVRLAGWIAPGVAIPAPVDPDDLSRDVQAVEAYRQDERVVRRLTLSWLAEVLEAQDEVLRRAGEVSLPILLLVGTDDEIADPERTRAIYESLASSDKTVRLYERFRHEVFNEIGRERVVADLVSWLDGRFGDATAPRPRGAAG